MVRSLFPIKYNNLYKTSQKYCYYAVLPVTEFKEFERRFKFKPRFKYGWFHLKLYQMFQKQILRFKRLYKSFLIQCKIVNDLNSCFLSK